MLRVLGSFLLLVAAGALSGCGGSGGCPPPSDLAGVPSAAFVARAAAPGTAQLVLLDTEGALVTTGAMAAPVWARVGTPLGATGARLGPAFRLARGIGAGGPTILTTGPAPAFAHVALGAGGVDLTSPLAVEAHDALDVTLADGSTNVLLALPTGVAAYGATAAGPAAVLGTVSTGAEVTGLVRVGTVVLALVTPGDDAPASASSVLVIDPARRTMVHRLDLDPALRGCRAMALLPPTLLDVPGLERRLAIACRGVPMPGLGRVGAGYAILVVGLDATRPPRVGGAILPGGGAAVPPVVSAIVGVPGGRFVHATVAGGEVGLVAVDVATGSVDSLASLPVAPPEDDTPLGAGAFDVGTGVLLWPAGTQVLRWTVVPGAMTLLGPIARPVLGCGVLPLVEIVALSDTVLAPGLDAGVPEVDAGVPEADAGVPDDAP